MNKVLISALAVTGLVLGTQAAAQIIFYEQENFAGRSFNTDKQVADFNRHGFNDRASSVVVMRDRWEICEHARFGGQCVVLRPGRYSSLALLGLNDRVSSVRMVSHNTVVEGSRYAPYPVAAAYDNSRRNGERLYEANVTSVHEVLATPQQRCWVEHQQVGQDHGGVNVPGAVVGAVIGGVLGHQVGSGHGNDAATVGGAVVGGAVGAGAGAGLGDKTEEAAEDETVIGTVDREV